MDVSLWIWVAGNLIVPAIPVACVFIAQKIAGQTPTVESVLRDGVLFFYAITCASILVMDLWKDRISEQPQVEAALATGFIVTSIVALIFLSGAYFIMALGHTGRLDREGQPFDLQSLSTLSWQCAVGMGILSLGARIWSGLY